MLENIWFKDAREKKLVHILGFSFFFTTVSVLLTSSLLPFSEGLVAVFMTCLAASYPIIRFLKEDEAEELKKRYSEEKLLSRHWKELEIFMALFTGALIAFTLAEFLVPPEFFSIQKEVIRKINPSTPLRGFAFSPSTYWIIVTNNLWVFTITFLVSFFISAGAIFVILWNASILGVFLSNRAATVFHVPLESLPFILHGSLEIAAYILAGIAGSLFSKQFSLYFFNKENDDETFSRIWKDVAVMVGIGIITIFVAGFFEIL